MGSNLNWKVRRGRVSGCMQRPKIISRMFLVEASQLNFKITNLVKGLVRYLWQSEKVLLLQRQRLQFTMRMENIMEVEKKMATNIHRVYSKESHKRWREDAKANGIQKRKNQEEYDRGLAKIRKYLSFFMKLLQKREEGPCLG